VTVVAEPTLLDVWLASQQELSAVDRFARTQRTLPADTRFYRDLVPATPPGPGQQYAFDVDLDACSSCKACVTACHSLNGLDAGESWRTVGLLHGGTATAPFQQAVTTACHHCVDPACLNGCPVDAYEKDPFTGIVRHLDDQCIGCSYCTLMCSYDVPRFDAERGIVRKCDMCADRLGAGEAPACVQACPTNAIRITIVDTSSVREKAAAAPWPIPGAPSPNLTVPATQYHTTRSWPADARPADHERARVGHAHLPLVAMLVLSQLAIGDIAVGALRAQPATPAFLLTPFALLTAAMIASLAHLGRPRYAFRAVIGVRHSWLSREVIALGTCAGLLAAAIASGVAFGHDRLPARALSLAAVGVGVVTVLCQTMVYVATRRPWWAPRYTATKFALTALAGGLAVSLCQPAPSPTPALALFLAAVTVLKLSSEAAFLRHRSGRHSGDLHRAARLLTLDLLVVTWWRFSAGIIGGVVLPLIVVSARDGAGLRTGIAVTGAVVLATGEALERVGFFAACSGPRMPGGRA